ncbi:MAG: hypothetical protein JNJ94_03670, partial [Chlorobi bacterium]|nr:hypothetical protein [Chlorobiota bacterium]
AAPTILSTNTDGAPAIAAVNSGTGHGVTSTTGNGNAFMGTVTGSGNGVDLTMNGTGTGVNVATTPTGTGRSGAFANNNAANPSNTVEILSNAANTAALAVNSTGASGNGIDVTTNGDASSRGVNVLQSGAGRAGQFYSSQPTNSNTVVYVQTDGNIRPDSAGVDVKLINGAEDGDGVRAVLGQLNSIDIAGGNIAPNAGDELVAGSYEGDAVEGINRGRGGRAAHFEIFNPNNIRNAVDVMNNNGTTADGGDGVNIFMSNTLNDMDGLDSRTVSADTGNAGRFTILTPSNRGNGVYATTNSTNAGNAVFGEHFGVTGNAGRFIARAVVGGNTHNDNAVFIEQQGINNALRSQNVNVGNGMATSAGIFEITQPTNIANVVNVTTNSNTGNGLFATTTNMTNTGNMVEAVHPGMGSAGFFSSTNTANAYTDTTVSMRSSSSFTGLAPGAPGVPAHPYKGSVLQVTQNGSFNEANTLPFLFQVQGSNAIRAEIDGRANAAGFQYGNDSSAIYARSYGRGHVVYIENANNNITSQTANNKSTLMVATLGGGSAIEGDAASRLTSGTNNNGVRGNQYSPQDITVTGASPQLGVSTAGVLGAVLVGGTGMPSGLNQNGKGIMGYNQGNTGFNGPVGGWAGVMRADNLANGLLITVAGQNSSTTPTHVAPTFRDAAFSNEVPPPPGVFPTVRQAVQIVAGGYVQSYARTPVNAGAEPHALVAEYMVWDAGNNGVAADPVNVTLPGAAIGIIPGQTISVMTSDPDGAVVGGPTAAGAGTAISMGRMNTYVWNGTAWFSLP